MSQYRRGRQLDFCMRCMVLHMLHSWKCHWPGSHSIQGRIWRTAVDCCKKGNCQHRGHIRSDCHQKQRDSSQCCIFDIFHCCKTSIEDKDKPCMCYYPSSSPSRSHIACSYCHYCTCSTHWCRVCILLSGIKRQLGSGRTQGSNCYK